MQDNNIREKCRELATRLYELDGEVYESVGSSLGRTFTGDREGTIRNLSALMYTKSGRTSSSKRDGTDQQHGQNHQG